MYHENTMRCIHAKLANSIYGCPRPRLSWDSPLARGAVSDAAVAIPPCAPVAVVGPVFRHIVRCRPVADAVSMFSHWPARVAGVVTPAPRSCAPTPPKAQMGAVAVLSWAALQAVHPSGRAVQMLLKRLR